MKKTYLSIFTALYAFAFSNAVDALSQKETYAALQLFGRVLERVGEEYVDEVPIPDLVEKALNGMLQKLDPNSSYLGIKDVKEIREQTTGSYNGIGIEIEIEDNAVIVIAPYEQTPAALAGIKPGDIITHINGISTRGLTIDAVAEKLKGRTNTAVEVTLERKGEPLDLKIVRKNIKVVPTRSKRFGNIGYIRILTFMNIHTVDEVKKDFQRMQLEQPLSALVLDLRDNPGGLFNEAIKVSELFLSGKEIVASKGRNAKDVKRFYAQSGQEIAQTLPLVVLVNGGTASCSEIVAAALQDHKRAMVMGTNTFGKGSIQSVIYLKNGKEALRLTTGRYVTPSGKTLERGIGITPDIIISSKEQESNDSADYLLKRALELSKGLSVYQNMLPR